MRLLIGGDTYAPDINGAARFVERLAHGMAERGHEVHVICPSPTGPAGPEPVRHLGGGTLTVHRVRSHKTPIHETFRVSWPWQAKAETRALVAAIDPDLVHVQSHFIVGRGIAYAADQLGLPLVATNHFMPENLTGYFNIPRALDRLVGRLAWRDFARVYGRAAAITAPTPRAVELLRTATDIGDDAQAISCGIDVNLYWNATLTARAAGTAAERAVPTVLFVGRLDQEKRVNELLRAFAGLPAELPARLEIIGDGDRRADLHRLAAHLGLGPDRVRFLGFVDDEQLLRAYGRADVFCMPGVAELQSLVTLEAMSAGKPVVAADAMALPHLVHPGRNGWLFTPGDVAGLRDRLASLLGDAGLRARMGEESRRMVAPHALADTLDAFEAVYDRVRDRARTPVTTAA
ncbi:glycosyltransferase involved in cell wall biosynthesis [Friedmanniella endophytica]|uniref:Glycosyltransferase involved in cell wall biosynthesis n=1 Tax=Microlunatus kandeliicorticis TaxID=1759536 RepID=A0A7W3IV89_9ACTN|nr:glycosyltransferase [Microlunatus kandeliicorticis]MBA8795889.1 glycosyltransferase involved in cell wall biosynthesis [Microlunatus kandeliicorticis]